MFISRVYLDGFLTDVYIPLKAAILSSSSRFMYLAYLFTDSRSESCWGHALVISRE